jgi:hypothetical protein
VGLFARRDTLPSPFDPDREVTEDQPCAHVCAQHPPKRYEGAKLSLQDLDQRASELGYVPAWGSARHEWIFGRQPLVPAYLMGGAVERRQAEEVYDPSPLMTAVRARRVWIEDAGRLPAGSGPTALLKGSREARELAELILACGVLTAEASQELMAP